MSSTLSSVVLITVLVSIGCLAYLINDFIRKRNISATNKTEKVKKKIDRESIIRDSNKKLSQDPRNYQALKELADLYYNEKDLESAFPLYEIMLDITSVRASVDQAENGLRYGCCALQLNKPEEAVNGLLLAKTAEPESFEVNFFLGSAYDMLKEYDKAILFFKNAITINPDYQQTYYFLGLSLLKAGRFREALPHIKQSLENNPEDKELLFSLAICMIETGNSANAQKIFLQLRIDPKYGPKSALYTGEYNVGSHKIDEAIVDFEIGLKHENIEPNIKKSLSYNLAQCYLKKLEIAKALPILIELDTETPGYKDVSNLLETYTELNKNMNLQVYLVGTASDFVALCRAIVLSYFESSVVKIVSISSTFTETEIVTAIETEKWQDTVLFRFYRTTGPTGELCIREFYSKVRDLKAGKGVCFTAGVFSDEAKKYIDVRPIDLIDRPELTKFLHKINTNQQQDDAE